MRTVALALVATFFLPTVAAADEPPPPPTDTFFAYDRPATDGVHIGRTNVPMRDPLPTRQP